VKNRRPITEDDLYLTEMLIARSYGNLKQSVVQVSSDTLSSMGGSLGGTIKKHPYATAGAAVGAGIILFGLFKLMSRGGSSKRRGERDREKSSHSDMGMEILSMVMPMVTPYLTAYLERYLGSMFSRSRDRNT
jgi:hypothetical protein